MKNQVIGQRIEIELVRRLFQSLPTIIWAESLVAVLWVVCMWSGFDHHELINWLIFNVVVCGITRQAMVLIYSAETKKTPLTYQSAHRWLAYFTLATFFSGISWGLTGSLFMASNDILRQSGEVFLLVSITAMANAYYSAFKHVYALFILASFIPFTIWVAMQGAIFIVLSLLCCVYVGVMLVSSSYMNNLLLRAWRYRFENQTIIQSITTAFSQLNQHNVQLETAHSLVKSTLDSTSDGIVVVNAEGKLVDYNEKFIKLSGINDALLHLNQDSNKLFSLLQAQFLYADEFNAFYNKIKESSDAEGDDQFKLKDGRVFEINSLPHIINKDYVGRVWSFHDATDRYRLEEKLYLKANFDMLTGLPNRVLTIDRISQAIAIAQSTHLKIAVFFVDLDKFKIINDTLGHQIGDKLLKQVADRIRKSIRENDTISREGGDEFLIMLGSLYSENDCINVARKCINAIHDTYVIDGNAISISASMGISFYPRDGVDPYTLIRNADIAMYKAKEVGGNHFQFFTESMNRKAEHRLCIENQLREAMDQNQFFLEYQPIVKLESGQIIGLEAILKWRHPVMGLVPPAEFLPIAGESGIIVAIAAWVMRHACRQVKTWQKQTGLPLQLSINVYARQFSQGNFHEQLQLILLETGFDPHYLVLEISENIIMEDVENNLITLQKLNEMGIMMVIDDFGSGYSSFNYLKRLPVNKLKIDRSFIKELPDNANHASIVSGILSLATPLHLKVIAEGVSNERQLDYLISVHCDEMQGSFVSPPVTPEAFMALLQRGRVIETQEKALT